VRPVGVHHVAINVVDATASVDFYTDVLGLTLRGDRPDLGLTGAWLDAGGQQVHLLEAPVPRNLGQHFALRVDDLDAVVAELRAKGVEVSDVGGVGAGRQAFLLDPSGNAVELHQRP
jgi:catechol 2,3-dioxygenase-like lactoylglutathione lyase family enzyme